MNYIDQKIEKLTAAQDILSRQQQKQADAEIAHRIYEQLQASAGSNNLDLSYNARINLLDKAETAHIIYLKIFNS